MTKQLLEKQLNDLRTRLFNISAKKEMTEESLKDKIRTLEQELAEQAPTIDMLQKYIADRERKIDDLQAENDVLKKEGAVLAATVEKLKMHIKKLLARLKKDSSSSSKPPSTDVFHKPKPQNLREKSGKKPGGQFGHPGHGLAPFANPDMIIEKRVEVCDECGHDIINSQDFEAKQKIDIEIRTVVTEERVYEGVCVYCGKKVRGQFDAGFVNPAQYGDNIKAAVALLSEHGCVSVNKTAEIINSLSGGALSLSWGTVVNMQRELSDRLEDTINVIRGGLIAGSVLCADETGCRVNGGLGWIQVFCNDRFALFGLNSKRGDVDEQFGILTFFLGILVHDHFVSYYQFENISHAECNGHILRYLKGLIEIFKHGWLKGMSELLKSACHVKNELVTTGAMQMPNDDVAWFLTEYDRILEEGRKEYEAATGGDKKKESYYVDERRLLDRLREYKEEHLRFLADFKTPFTNNMSERDIRKFKNKARVSGCFRSAEGAQIYARIVSVITTMKKQNINVFNGLRAVYSGQVPISSA
jgi:transposase